MNREYPLRPIAGVAAIIFQGHAVLLTKRENPPGKGNWALPGGAVELGESVKGAVVRELQEECGLRVRPEKVLTVFDSITRDEEGRVRFHYVLVEFLCVVIGGVLTTGTDSEESRWVSLTELEDLPMNQGTRSFIRKVASEQSKRPIIMQ